MRAVSMMVISAAVVFLLSELAYGIELTIGLIPEQNVFKQAARYKPLGDYIAKKTGIKIRFTVLSRYGNIIDQFTREKFDGAFFGSFTGALAIRKLGVEPLVRPVNLDGSSTYWGYIFVRKKSGIKTVTDMKGKRIAFVDKATTAGYVFPVAFFREHGVNDIKGYFSEYYFAGSHDAVVDAVLDKNFDVGCAKHSIFDQLSRSNSRLKRELLILAKSPHVPSNGLGVRGDLSGAVKKQLKEALLSMDKDAEGKEILKRFEAIRFIPTVREDYQPVFDIARRAGIDLKTYDYMNK